MKKQDLNEQLKRDLLSKNLEDFEKAIGFTEASWQTIKSGLSLRESRMKAHLNQMAPDFSALKLTDKGELSNASLSLADFKGKGLALVFGSYTCPVFRRHNRLINTIYESFKQDISFLHIYVYEMHAVNNWFLPINLKDNVVYDQPTSILDRSLIVRDWMKAEGIKMPVAMDDMNNTIDALYAGSPERLYLIDEAGVIRFRSSEGPFDDSEVEAWGQSIKNMIS